MNRPDDYTVAARAEYERYRREAERFAPPAVDPEWSQQGPTAVVMQSAWRTNLYLAPPAAAPQTGAA